MKINDLGVAFRKYGRVLFGLTFLGWWTKWKKSRYPKRAWITGRGMLC